MKPLTLAGHYIYLEKIERRNAKHSEEDPYKVGDILEGYCLEEPEEGIPFLLYPYHLPKMDNIPICWTSIVQEIDFEKMQLRTQNSVYKIIIDDPETD